MANLPPWGHPLIGAILLQIEHVVIAEWRLSITAHQKWQSDGEKQHPLFFFPECRWLEGSVCVSWGAPGLHSSPERVSPCRPSGAPVAGGRRRLVLSSSPPWWHPWMEVCKAPTAYGLGCHDSGTMSLPSYLTAGAWGKGQRVVLCKATVFLGPLEIA